jgi:hypothetical protein
MKSLRQRKHESKEEPTTVDPFLELGGDDEEYCNDESKNENTIEDVVESTPNEISHNRDITSIMRERKKEKEPTHKQQSFYIRRDLLKEMSKAQKKFGYGFKTEFINLAIENELKRLKAK